LWSEGEACAVYKEKWEIGQVGVEIVQLGESANIKIPIADWWFAS